MVNFKWVGKTLENPYESCNSQKCTFYKSFSLHNVIYKIGEFIVEKNNAEVCRLLGVYESEEDRHENAPYKAFVQRYTHARDIDLIFDKANISYDEEYEVVKDDDRIDIEFNLELTKSKCKVIYATTDEDIYLSDNKENSSPPTFFCRYKLESNKLSPIIIPEDSKLQRNNPKNGKNRNRSSDKNSNKTWYSPSMRNESTLTENEYLNMTNEFNDEMELVDSKTKAIKITTPAKSSVKRNLCESFESDRASIKNYSIIHSDSGDFDADRLKLKLRVSNVHKNSAEKMEPVVLLENLTLSDIDTTGKYSLEDCSPRKKLCNELNKNDRKYAENIRCLRPKCKEAITPIRRSTRNNGRVSYAAFMVLLNDSGSEMEAEPTERKITRYKRITNNDYSERSDSDDSSDSHRATPKKRRTKSNIAEEIVENKTSQQRPKTSQTRSKRLESTAKYNGKSSSDPESSDSENDSDLAEENLENKTNKHTKSQQTLKTPQTRSKRLKSTSKNERKTSSDSESSDTASDSDIATPRKRRALSKVAEEKVENKTIKSQQRPKSPQTRSKRLESTFKNGRISNSDSESSDTASDSDLATLSKRRTLSKVAEEKAENKTIKNIKSQQRPKTPQTRSKRLESTSKNERKSSSDSESSDSDISTPRKRERKVEKLTIRNTKSRQTPKTPQTRSKRLKSTTKNERKSSSDSEISDSDLTTPRKRRALSKVAVEKVENKTIKNIKSQQTPRTPRTSSRRLESTPKSTPRSCIKSLRNGLITPSLKSRDSIVPLNTTPLMKARAQLHVSFVPTVLPCREKEYQDVYNFLKGKLTDNCGGCMYVSGVPGTGKTATVTSVIQKLTELSESNKRSGVPKFTFVSINGMKLTEPRQAYVEILRQLTKKTVPWEQAQSMLDEKFTKTTKDKVPIVLLIDELDILCTKRQDVVYTLLDWPSKSKKQLIIVTIANTMDLPERLLMSRVTSRLGLTRLTFQAYTYKQLQEIVTKRLTGTNSFNPDAVQLVARKVASVSGDARRALDICRKAAEIAELDGPDTFVTMTHINEALSDMMTQPKVQAIKHCSRLEQLMLQAIVAEVERTGVEETVFSDVYKMLQSVSVLDGFQLVNTMLALKAVARLNACRLIIADQKCDISERIILNVSSDDVYYALKND